MEGATHVAWVATAAETLWRVYRCNPYVPPSPSSGDRAASASAAAAATYLTHSYWAYTLGYCLCVLAIFLDLKRYAKWPPLRSVLSFLHAADGVIALVLALAFYFKSTLLLVVGVVAITKVFLLHLLSRMVTGEAAFSPLEITLQTTKTFLHHTGSFLFICDDTTALITGVWRFISMNGHAALTYRESLDEATYDRITWAITHMRNVVVVAVLGLCAVYPGVRRGFALSATGHVAYMLVRLGPVFRIGSMYMTGPEEKKRWAKELTDTQRLRLLLSGRYPWFALELAILAVACVTFSALRLSTYGDVAQDSCYII